MRTHTYTQTKILIAYLWSRVLLHDKQLPSIVQALKFHLHKKRKNKSGDTGIKRERKKKEGGKRGREKKEKAGYHGAYLHPSFVVAPLVP